jgi:ubiquinone/menaquinone biosynthesis C-methylase UbiE
VSQKEAWEAVAGRWVELVRGSSIDDESRAFFALLPPPAGPTLDLACGEGRITRELTARGYETVGVDSSPAMVALAGDAHPGGRYEVADAAALPFDDGAFDLVVAFMSLQDMDDAGGALQEAGRVLAPAGRLCLAIIHPIWTSGEVEEESDRLVIRGSYLATVPHIRPLMRVPSIHRPLEAYFRGLEAGGLVVETLREPPSRKRLPGRMPLYVHARALKR